MKFKVTHIFHEGNHCANKLTNLGLMNDKLDKYLVFKLIKLSYLFLFHMFCVILLEVIKCYVFCLVRIFFFLLSYCIGKWKIREDFKVV